jgi:hypothetical protein
MRYGGATAASCQWRPRETDPDIRRVQFRGSNLLSLRACFQDGISPLPLSLPA